MRREGKTPQSRLVLSVVRPSAGRGFGKGSGGSIVRSGFRGCGLQFRLALDLGK